VVGIEIRTEQKDFKTKHYPMNFETGLLKIPTFWMDVLQTSLGALMTLGSFFFSLRCYKSWFVWRGRKLLKATGDRMFTPCTNISIVLGHEQVIVTVLRASLPSQKFAIQPIQSSLRLHNLIYY
jgi:hypothetical protein